MKFLRRVPIDANHAVAVVETNEGAMTVAEALDRGDRLLYCGTLVMVVSIHFTGALLVKGAWEHDMALLPGPVVESSRIPRLIDPACTAGFSESIKTVFSCDA